MFAGVKAKWGIQTKKENKGEKKSENAPGEDFAYYGWTESPASALCVCDGGLKGVDVR